MPCGREGSALLAQRLAFASRCGSARVRATLFESCRPFTYHLHYINYYSYIYVYMFQFQVLPVRGYPPPNGMVSPWKAGPTYSVMLATAS